MLEVWQTVHSDQFTVRYSFTIYTLTDGKNWFQRIKTEWLRVAGITVEPFLASGWSSTEDWTLASITWMTCKLSTSKGLSGASLRQRATKDHQLWLAQPCKSSSTGSVTSSTSKTSTTYRSQTGLKWIRTSRWRAFSSLAARWPMERHRRTYGSFDHSSQDYPGAMALLYAKARDLMLASITACTAWGTT